MRKRNLVLTDYGISTWRYRELYALCRQYPEMQRELAAARELDARCSDGMPHGNTVTDPTARRAEAALKIREKIAVIEDAAREADAVNWKELLENVTRGTRYEYLQVYCGRRQFYENRRKFFWLLDQRSNL